MSNQSTSRARAFSPAGRPIRTDGVRSIEDIRQRCRIDEVTGCWVWGYSCGGDGRPSLWLPQIAGRTSIGVALCVLTTGERPKPGRVWHSTCRNPLCANPRHRKEGDRKSQMKAARIVRSPLDRAHIAAGKRAMSRITDAQCDEIRASTETLRVLAERYGISMSHVSDIRRGASRKPLAARGSSVFSLGAT